MSAPEGNTNAKGNKGGGRKSAYQEHADAEALYKMFFEVVKGEDVKKKIESGKFSLKDALMAKGYQGDTRVLTAIFNRVFPANVNIGGQEGNPIRFLDDKQIDDRIKQLSDGLKTGIIESEDGADK